MVKPLLILAFNRPHHVKKLIDSLRPHAPQKVLVGVDGPRPNNKDDAEKVSQVLEQIGKIDWTSDIELRVRENNLGLRFAVADAVTWAIEKYGEVIVVEDDVEIGPDFLNFMSAMLDKFRDDKRIGHISGYNLVPKNFISEPANQIRLSRIPESYAWGTWERSWKLYASRSHNFPSFNKLSELLSSWKFALVWSMNFFDARKENLNTWAYRWVATLWDNELLCVSPNVNLLKYTGNDLGTHVRSKPRYQEIPIEPLGKLLENPSLDAVADLWIQETVFMGTLKGLILRFFQSMALNTIRLTKKVPRQRRPNR